jgi:hypothetical protein
VAGKRAFFCPGLPSLRFGVEPGLYHAGLPRPGKSGRAAAAAQQRFESFAVFPD